MYVEGGGVLAFSYTKKGLTYEVLPGGNSTSA